MYNPGKVFAIINNCSQPLTTTLCQYHYIIVNKTLRKVYKKGRTLCSLQKNQPQIYCITSFSEKANCLLSFSTLTRYIPLAVLPVTRMVSTWPGLAMETTFDCNALPARSVSTIVYFPEGWFSNNTLNWLPVEGFG